MEAPALSRIQSEYIDRDVVVVAINIWPDNYSLRDWMSFWQRTGAGDLLLAQDAKNSTVRDYRLVALGTEVLIDRQGAAAFRSNGPSGYDKIKSEIEKVL